MVHIQNYVLVQLSGGYGTELSNKQVGKMVDILTEDCEFDRLEQKKLNFLYLLYQYVENLYLSRDQIDRMWDILEPEQLQKFNKEISWFLGCYL